MDVLFFFSSRRRHTRYIGDWSSDVCSSDLVGGLAVVVAISYGLSSGDEAQMVADSFAGNPNIETSAGTVKNVGMGLNVFFILTAVAVVLMVFPGLKKLFVK